MIHDWPTIQDAQITAAREALDRLADDPSAIRRLAVVTDGFIPNKHLVNVHVVKRHSDAFRIDVGCGTGELLARLLSAFPLADGIGVDPNSESLSGARTRRVGRRSGEPRPPFNVVICSEVLSTSSSRKPADACASTFGSCRHRGADHHRSAISGKLQRSLKVIL